MEKPCFMPMIPMNFLTKPGHFSTKPSRVLSLFRWIVPAVPIRTYFTVPILCLGRNISCHDQMCRQGLVDDRSLICLNHGKSFSHVKSFLPY